MIFPYRGLVIFLISVIILIGSIVYALEQVSQLKKGLVLVNQTNTVVNELDLLVLNISESESYWLGYLLTHNDEFIQKYNMSVRYINAEVVTLFNILPRNPKQRSKFKELTTLISEKIGIQNDAISLKGRGKLTSDEMLMKFNLGRLYLDRIKYVKELIILEEEKLIQIRQKNTNENVKGTIYGILFSFIGTFIVGLFLFVFILKYIRAEKKLKLNLEELNDNKNKFFSIISHDLRGPVNNVASLTDLLKTNISSEEKGKLVNMIQVSIGKVKDLLVNLLKWTSIQMNNVQLVPQVLHPKELADQNIQLLSDMAATKDILIHNEITQEVTLWADHEMTSTVLRNLISNAIKFTRTGGLITISSRLVDSMTEISVKDSGVGMSKEQIQNLFRSDIKTSTRGTANESGSGLGLKICKEFIERNHGKLIIESEINKGSVFKFILRTKGN